MGIHFMLPIFLVYINDISEKITFTVKLFAVKPFFSVVNDPNISANELNKDFPHKKNSEILPRISSQLMIF